MHLPSCVRHLKFGLEIKLVKNSFEFGEGKEIVMVHTLETKSIMLKNMRES